MVVKADPLPALYEADETAWLDEMVRRILLGRRDDLDYRHLAEFLDEMADGTRDEVENRLVVLMAHWLKWEFQPLRRTASWRATIVEQANALRRRFRRKTLRNHAEAILADIYADAAGSAEAETGLPEETFPAECPYTLDGLLATDEVRRYREPPLPGGRRKKRPPSGNGQ